MATAFRCLASAAAPRHLLHGRAVGNIAKLAEGLILNSKPLMSPRFYDTGWMPEQIFGAEEDPDRLSEAWVPPAFLRYKNPLEQRARTSVEELDISAVHGALSSSFARIVSGVVDEEECTQLVESLNEKGFTPALLNIGGGKQKLARDVRDGHRVIVDSFMLADWIFKVIRPHLPEQLRGARLIDMNERCRFLLYTPGQYFVPHRDGRYVRPHDHRHSGDISLITLQMYLHGLPTSHGGATAFIGRDGRPMETYQPIAGSCLLFTQELQHEGCQLTHGLKYTMRTEAMYRRGIA